MMMRDVLDDDLPEGGCEANERVSGFLLLYASLKMEKLNEFFIMLIDIV
jgi:hypothetical protein